MSDSDDFYLSDTDDFNGIRTHQEDTYLRELARYTRVIRRTIFSYLAELRFTCDMCYHERPESWGSTEIDGEQICVACEQRHEQQQEDLAEMRESMRDAWADFR